MSPWEDYRENHKKALIKILRDCNWQRIGVDLYEKARSRIYVDDIGIFLFRWLAGRCVRVAGRPHNLITSQMLRERVLLFRDFEINLFTGE